MSLTRPFLAFALVTALVGCAEPTPTPDKAHPASTGPARGPDTRTSGAGADAPDRPAGGAAFGLYVLALSWAPNFCCGHSSKEECSALPGSFAATHLTLHGLWPSYTDAESKGAKATYPQFCGAYEHCRNSPDRTCEPSPAAIPAEMKRLAPGYVGDGYFLADHEWPKHGGCTGLDAAAYFRAALDAMKKLPGDEGTPGALRAAVGKDIALADLQGAFGLPESSVLLSCDPQCRLAQVSICLAHGASGLPTTPVTCPGNTTSADYDNGCVTHGCSRITVQAAGSCDIGGGGHHPAPPDHGGSATTCNHPGQGPACTGDRECAQAGFRRCARSGCCTSVP